MDATLNESWLNEFVGKFLLAPELQDHQTLVDKFVITCFDRKFLRVPNETAPERSIESMKQSSHFIRVVGYERNHSENEMNALEA